jgi:hypothetical protein
MGSCRLASSHSPIAVIEAENSAARSRIVTLRIISFLMRFPDVSTLSFQFLDGLHYSLSEVPRSGKTGRPWGWTQKGRKKRANPARWRRGLMAFLIASLIASTLTQPTLGVGFG